MKKIAFIMGSDSDLPVAEKAFEVFREYEVPFEAHVYSAHRTPAEAKAFAENAEGNGFGAIICAAGMAAHLAGAIAANTVLPVMRDSRKVLLRWFGRSACDRTDAGRNSRCNGCGERRKECGAACD